MATQGPPQSLLRGNQLGTHSHPKATTKPPSCDLHVTSKPGRRYFGFLAAEGPSLVCGRWRVVTMCGGERTEPRAGGAGPGLLSQQIVWSALQLGPGACNCEAPGRCGPLAHTQLENADRKRTSLNSSHL